MKIFNYVLVTVVLTVVFGLTGSNTAHAATSPTLTDAASFSVLGGQEVTCTGGATVTGDVGVSSGTSITGFPGLCTVSPGTTQSNTSSAIAAQAENLSTFGALNAGENADAHCIGGILPDATDLTTQFPAGIGPGLYCSAGSFLLSGNLNLTGSGVWVFKTVSTLITSSNSSVTGGDPCSVWWRVGSSVTLGPDTSFIGNILALDGVNAMDDGASLNGRLLVQDAGTVTLINNDISGTTCAGATVASSGSGDNDKRGGGDHGNGNPKHKSVPKLPSTGVAPDEKNFSWNIIALAGGILMLVSTTLVVVMRKRTI